MPFSPSIEQLTLPLRFPEEEQLETFFGEANQKFIQTVQTHLFNNGQFEIFYLYGKSGWGKTHFLKAICMEGLKAGKACAYIPLRERQTISVSTLSELEDYELLVMDDLHAIIEDISWQTAIFHLYNRMWSSGKTKLLISSLDAPVNLNFQLPDLVSRLNSGHLFDLSPLSESELLEALQCRAQLRGLTLSPHAGLFFIKKIYPDQQRLFSEWKKLDARSFQTKHRITIPFIKTTLDLY